MAERWRIFVVEDDESLNRNIVSSLRKDGYIVNGSTNGRDAVRILWAEVHDVVICDVNTPGADGFELLQWLRAYRPNTRVVLFGGSAPSLRTQALEGGAVSYLEKPLDMHLLKEELRRLLVQTGFSADLDSFDLLDVIQIVSASRKNIALLISTGLEERGMLCFQNGNLVWAEYGMLRGEEAFFALAAHKNGTVVHQPWNQQVTPNVTQPLSRLILQAFQYRTKYNQIQQQLSGEQQALAPSVLSAPSTAPPSPIQSSPSTLSEQDDDAPFMVLTEYTPDAAMEQATHRIQEAFPAHADTFIPTNNPSPVQTQGIQGRNGMSEKEWWEQTGKFSGIDLHAAASGVPATPLPTSAFDDSGSTSIIAPIGQKTTVELNKGSNGLQHNDLPSWLTDQPTAATPAVRPPPTCPINTSAPLTPIVPTPAEWQATQIQEPLPPIRTSRKLVEQRVKATGPHKAVQTEQRNMKEATDVTDTEERKAASAEWQVPHEENPPQSGPLENLVPSRITNDTHPLRYRQIPRSDGGRGTSSSNLQAMPRPAKRNYNYAALVSALQTLGYSINGFIAAAVVSIDGQPIAQVAVDDLDMSKMCKHFSVVMKSVLQSLDSGVWGEYENVVITSADRYILMRIVGGERNAFQVLVTTREANLGESGSVMVNVEGAITAALR